MKGGFLLDVVVTQGASIFKLLSGEDKTLLIRGNSFLVLDLGLDVVNGVRGFDIESDSLSGKGLDEDLHSSAETENQVKGGFLLDVVVTQGAAVFKLLSGEDKTLLIRGNTFLVLDLGLDVVNGVRRFNIESDGLSGKGLDEDLHSSAKTENQVKGRLLLDIVVTQGAAVFKLLSGEDKTLLIRGNSFLVLDLGLDVVNGVGGLDIQGDGLARKGFYENLQKRSVKRNL